MRDKQQTISRDHTILPSDSYQNQYFMLFLVFLSVVYEMRCCLLHLLAEINVQ